MVAVTPDGFAEAWQLRGGVSAKEVEVLSEAAATLFNVASRSSRVPGSGDRDRMVLSILTTHGCMVVGETDDGNLLMVLTTEQTEGVELEHLFV